MSGLNQFCDYLKSLLTKHTNTFKIELLAKVNNSILNVLPIVDGVIK